MSSNLRGKVILVTGASSGIGRSFARLAASEGATLALAARSVERLERLRDELLTEAGPPAVLPTDLAKPADVDRMVSNTLARFGRIDVLVANAGVYVSGTVAEGDPVQWEDLLAINVNSVFRAVRATLPGMIARGTGDVLVTSSISGHQAIPWEPVYSASKHAVQSFVHGTRRQVAASGVRVGAVAPGMVLNELWGIEDKSVIDEKVEARTGLRSEDVAEAMLFMLTRPRHVTIRDLVILPQNQDL